MTARYLCKSMPLGKTTIAPPMNAASKRVLGCDNLHPYADMAEELPHNYKVYSLCLIKKMGLEEWAKSKAAEVREVYFNKPWSLK